jgi:hypothetical protein
MAVNLSPVGGVAAQFFTNNGTPLTGGKLYTYTAGTTTPAATYTTSSGATPWTNPIVLDAGGRVPGSGEIWLTDGVNYKFVLKDSTDVLIATYDNINGINSNFVNYTNEQELQTATAGQTVFTLTTMQYEPGTGSLSVFVDGVNQYGPSASYAFVETSSTVVTFTSGLHVGASVKFTTSSINASSYGDAFQISYTPPFTDSVATNVGDKLAQTVSILDFGDNISPGTTDMTAAFQAAVDSFDTLGGAVYFPGEGPYRFDAGISTDKNLTIRGDGKQTTVLKYYGSSTFIEQTDGDVLGFEDVIIAGNGTTSGPVAVVGSVGYKAANNSYSQNADFIFWHTVSEWQAGYYHKHFNSFFRYSTYLFNGYDQNNFAFFGCAFSNFQQGVEITSGEGPLTFTGGSIEYCAAFAFTSASGRGLCVNLIGTYVEQGVGVACQSGITSATGFYDNGTIIYTNGSEVYPCSFIGCTVFTPGIFRMFWTDSTDGCHVIGQGNNFISRGGTPLGTIYSLGGTTVRALLDDVVVGALPSGFTDYVTGLPTDLEGCTVYDPVADQWLRPSSQGWTNLTLVNGFTNEGTPFANASYFQNKDGVIYLRGVVDGTAATNVGIATLPVGYRPANTLNFSVPSVFSPGSTLQLSVYSTGAIVLVGTAPFADQIGLDGVSFYVNS